MKCFVVLALTGLVGLSAYADEAPYAGQDMRTIKALAPERIEGLLKGAGLGYAKAAELNGWPGPLHVLELSDALALNADQHAKITSIRNAMLAKARPLGDDLIKAEIDLDALFTEEWPDASAVAEATAKVGAIDAELRAVHLAAHIDVKPLLTQHQQMVYAQHRGYGTDHGGHENHKRH